MAIRKVLTYPEPSLNKPSTPVEEISEEILQLIADMGETMIDSQGVGLAAPQVGINKQIIVFDPNVTFSAEAEEEEKNSSESNLSEKPQTFKALINPKIIKGTGKFLSEQEGCLSVPDFRSDVMRFETVQVKALEPSGKPIEFEKSGLQAVIMQHEIDHLEGKLFIERISSLKRAMYKKRVKKQLKLKKI